MRARAGRVEAGRYARAHAGRTSHGTRRERRRKKRGGGGGEKEEDRVACLSATRSCGVVVYWWCTGGVPVVYWWCTDGVQAEDAPMVMIMDSNYSSL